MTDWFKILADELKKVDANTLTKEQAAHLMEAIAGARAICANLQKTADDTRKKAEEVEAIADQMQDQIDDLEQAISIAEDLVADREDLFPNDMSGLDVFLKRDN